MVGDAGSAPSDELEADAALEPDDPPPQSTTGAESERLG